MSRKSLKDSQPVSTPADTQSGVTSSSETIDNLLTQKQAAWDAVAPIRSSWSDRERLLINRPSDTYSQKSTRSHVTDGHLPTLAFDRQARVAAQLPTGTIYALDSKDEKSAILMNLVLNKYILPNANSQMDALTKLRMSGVYASLYGACPIMYDYRVDDEYIGPDFFIVLPRNFYPQPGKNSIRDCDWVMISTIQSVSYLESIAKKDAEKTSWNVANVKEVIKQAKTGTVPKRDIDSSQKSGIENARTFGRPFGDKGSAARIELVTKYEKGKNGRWITFAPDFKDAGILRDIPNPHKNGRIPVVMRQCFPLADSIWGLGHFELGITLQKAKDSLINLYLDGVKMAIFPPIKIDPTNVTMSTIRMEAGARWLMKDPNAITTHDSHGGGALQNFQGTYQFITSALLNQWGSNSQQISKQESGNPSLGKTPQAIQAQQEREDALVNWDRFQLEKTIEDLLEGMINLLAENQEKPINFHVFDADVEQIMQQCGDFDDMGEAQAPDYMKVMGKSAKMTVAKSLIKGNYKLIVDGSSTMKQEEEAQAETLTQIMNLYLLNPQAIDQLLQQSGLQFSFGAAMKSYIYNSGVQDPDSIITKVGGQNGQGVPQMQPPQIDPQQLEQFQDPDIRNALGQMFGGQQQPQQMPQGGMNGQ